MPEAGWYDDPQDPTQVRWWDGAQWTELRQPRSGAELPPPPPPTVRSGIPRGADGPRDSTHAWATASDSGDWGASGSVSLDGAAPPRTFFEAVKVCLTKYVDGKGRASRSEYWYFALFTFLVDVVTGGVAAILLLLPSITVSVRRLHDIGKSAWALLWMLLPIIGWIVLIVYALRPGEPRANAFG